jgi:chemotaxis protein MotA
LLGIGSANVIYLPVANRLKGLSAAEVELRTLTLDGILAVQAGDNPRVVAEKLNSYIAPVDRVGENGEPAAAAGQEDDAQAA